ncbi:MAG TPA: DUF4276 family protein [Anaerolineales bacterium]|nr:DUF4276 family protein [Anaerolineales bacterium]
MKAEHLEILVEEPSMEAFLRELLPRMLGPEVSFQIYPHQGKNDLLSKLLDRLRGYAKWLPEEWRIVIIVDRDNDDCSVLKEKMEKMAMDAGLLTRTSCTNQDWQVVNRIAIEELEAWYFGDWEAVREVYPKVSANIPQRDAYRESDDVLGGTWEAFERLLKKAGYFKNGLRKIEAAREIGRQVDSQRNRSRSFQVLRDAILEAV